MVKGLKKSEANHSVKTHKFLLINMKKIVWLSIGMGILLLTIFVTCQTSNQSINEDLGPVHEIMVQDSVKLEYGIAIDSFTVVENKVKRDQNLSEILIGYGVTPQTIDQIANQNDVFDVRQIRSGNKYKLFFAKDSAATLSYFVYEQSLTDYVVVTLADSVEITLGEKPTTILKKTARGTIQSNLWEAMVDNQINPMMSIELSEIYAWSIDFFGLQKGDEFYVIYEERFLDSVSVGIEQIHAALFNHQGKDFYALYFVQDNQPSIFDEEGNSLRKAFLKAPLKFNRISSRFSKNRFHPVLKIYRAHSGVDYAAPEGTPVFSIGDGVVAKKGYQQAGAGNYVTVKHNSVYTTQYAHLKSFAPGLKMGDHVNQGQLLGYVGKTGYATGPHLDFRFFKNGDPVDPLKVEAPSVEPIKKENHEPYHKIKEEFMPELQKVRDNFKLKIAAN